MAGFVFVSSGVIMSRCSGKRKQHLQWNGPKTVVSYEFISRALRPLIIPFSELVQWLWPKLIQQELNQLQEQFNNHRVCKESAKNHPLGVSPNVAFALYTNYQAENCLQVVDCKTVKQLMDSIGGEDLICFVLVEYENHAETVFSNLGFKVLSFHNVWNVFSAMLSLI